VIRATGLTKRYGTRRVLERLDLEVGRGGFLLVTGPNGAGKTTLLRLLAGLAAPTAGTLAVEAPRAAVGFLGHDSWLYRELTPLENLDLYGRLYRVPERRERAGMLLERFGLWEERRTRVADFSRGMVQRLALCRTLLHQPELLLLDEPYAGLDTDAAALVDRELRELGGERTVVLSTHAPERVERLATTRLALAARS
jgi:ABC-type multidrug transport system ATPase subunit